MWKGILNNEVDAAIASTISGQAKEAESSPRGLLYPPVPAADKAGWARMNKIGPYYAPHKATCGVGITPQNPVELPNYPYPILMAYASQPADVVYNIARSMIADYSAYKDGAPGAAGLELSRQNLSWVLPYHEGTVRAFKEAGAWKAEHDAHQQKALARQATRHVFGIGLAHKHDLVHMCRVVDLRQVGFRPLADAGNLRAIRGLASHDLDLRVLFLEETRATHNRASRSHAADEMGELALRIAPNFRRSAFIVRERIIGIGKLIEYYSFARIAQFFSGVAGQLHAAFLGG